MGTITVENKATRQRDTQQKNRGQIRIGTFMIGQTGFNPKAHFQATGKNFIVFKSPKAVYSDSFVGAKKAVNIKHGIKTNIFVDQDRTTGISVTFDSFIGN